MKTPYHIAQRGLADIKAAIYLVLKNAPEEGMRNVDIGRTLGINYGHSGKHHDHIPRTMLEIMQQEGVVEQHEKNKRWTLKRISNQAIG